MRQRIFGKTNFLEMKTNRITVLLVLIATVSTTWAQCESIVIDDHNYPGLCVSNVISWLNMPRNEWTEEMGKFDFTDSGYVEGNLYYSTGDKHLDRGVRYIVERSFGLIKLQNIPSDEKSVGFFNDLISEIEPYFVEKKEGDISYFRFSYLDGFAYEFAVIETNQMDIIFCRKL